MPIKNKGCKIEKLLTLLFFALSLLILVGFVPFRLRALNHAVEGALRGAGADSVSVGAVSVTLFRGARVDDLSAYKRISASEEYRVAVRRADVSCNLFGIAAAMAVNPRLFSNERDMFREAYEKPLELAGGVCARLMSLRQFRKVSVRGAGVWFAGRGAPGVSAEGVSASVSRRGGRRSLSGEVSAASAVVPYLAKIENFSAKLRAEGGRLDLTGGSGAVFGGRVSAELSLGLEDSRVISGQASVRGLDLAKFCAGTGFSPGSMAGIVNMDAALDPGAAAALDSIRATGSVSVGRLTVTDIALLKTAAVNQVSRDLRSLRFSEVRGGFRLSGGRLRFGEITGVGEVLSFRAAGSVGFDGKMDYDMDGEFSGKFVAALPKLVRNSLEPTESGGGRFKCKISGTFHRPRVEIDRSVYDRAIGGFFRNLFK